MWSPSSSELSRSTSRSQIGITLALLWHRNGSLCRAPPLRMALSHSDEARSKSPGEASPRAEEASCHVCRNDSLNGARPPRSPSHPTSLLPLLQSSVDMVATVGGATTLAFAHATTTIVMSRRPSSAQSRLLRLYCNLNSPNSVQSRASLVSVLVSRTLRSVH